MTEETKCGSCGNGFVSLKLAPASPVFADNCTGYDVGHSDGRDN